MKRNITVWSRVLIPFFTLLYLLLPFNAVAQDVQVLLRPKMDPMPPQVMNYIGNPGTYFDVSLTNTTDEVQNVFLTLEVSKQSGSELSVTTPYYVQPNKAITLVPKRLTTVDQVTLLGQFRQLDPNQVTLKGANVSDFYDNGVVGLLPEGTYQAQVKVYKWDPAVKYPQLVSDPLQGKCTFSVCYNASSPEILVPLYNSLELSQNAVGTPKPETPGVVSDKNDAKWQPAILDPAKAQFVWKTPVINCGGKARSYKYQLDIYPIGTTHTTAEEAVALGTVAKTVKNLVAAQCLISEAEVTQIKKFSSTGYYVARVTATPTVTDKNNVDYSTVENNGHSQLLVFRFKQDAYDKGGKVPDVVPENKEEKKDEEVKEEKKEDEKKEVDPGYKEPDKNSDKKFVYYPPKLTDPKPFKGNVFKADGDIKLKWEKPEKKSGGNDTHSFTYNVKVFKKTASQSIEKLLEDGKPLFEEKSLSATNYTVRWDDIKEKVKLNDNLVIAVVPVCTNESSVGYDNEDGRNLYRGSYVTGETGKLIDCDPDAAKEITNRTLAFFSEKDLRDLEVKCGKFPLTIENANLVEDHYEGRGYITWKPMGDLPFKINVKFDKLYINSDKVVYDGEVVSAKEEEQSLNDYIPYEMFDDLFLADLVGAGTAEAYGEKLFDYIENDQKMAKYCEWAREAAPIIDDIIKGQVTVNLPVSLTKLIPTCPVDIQIMSGRWSPTNASVSIIGMFALNDTKYTDSQVAVFGLPRLCIEPDSFVPSGCTMALLADFYIKDPNTNFVFTLKAPSDLQKMDDGCSLSFTNKGFQELNFEADMEIPGLIKADEKGERVKGQRPHIDIKAKIKDWDNWIGQLKMDNFEVEEAPGFTFCPSGDGLIYDHSITDNGKGFKFPEPMTPKGGIDKNYKPKTYDKTALGINSTEDEVKWQGLYLDKLGVWLPPIFKQGDGNNRIEVAMKQFLWDDSGVSLTISAAGTNGGDIVGVETGKMGGWGISLHEVGVSVIQNDFGCAYFTGMVKAPLIGGKWNYSTSFDKIDKGAGGSDLRILFHMQPDGDPEFDFLLAKVSLDEKYTHLDVQYTNADKETKVELEMAGHITIAGTEEITKSLDLDISGVAFTGMRVANFAKPKESNNKSEAQAMKFSHTFDPICEGPKCWFDMGTWGLASPSKKLGPFEFSLDNFGVDKKDDLVGVNIVGTVGLVGDVFSATAGVTIWAKVDLNSMDIDYEKTTLDELGLKSEFGGCKVAGTLKFVDKDENKGTKVKGYAGTLEIDLPGGLFNLKAAGGFFNASDDKHGRFTSAYFLAEVGGASGIPIGPVQLNNIMGGFFFHTSLDMASVEANETDPFKWKTSIQYGTHGGMFGLGISTVGSDRGLNAKVKMTVLYDAERNKLSTFRMTGEMHALCVPGSDDGMINGKCCIVYQNMPENEGGKYFQINITMDAGGDMDKMYEQFTGQKFQMPECLGDLAEMADQGKDKSKDAEETKPKVSCGVNISLDFKVTMKPDDCTDPKFKSKWHLYVGQPGDGSPTSLAKDRCSITVIDFQVGDKKGKAAAWCKIWANAYLCIGNELPNDGKLPPIPKEIDEFLNGSKKDSHLSESGQNRTNEVNNKRNAAVKDFDGAAKSGVMFGAQAGGDFGVRAVICYAQATLLAGFDVVLKQLEDAQCNGKPAGGKGGFYGTGQIYAMAKGEMGLIIDLWIYKGDWSLVDVGVGALLKGGFPNPSWMYGKVKATCKLFGGLIKFSGSLSFELGDVCFPDAGNPLDDIKIFEDMTPGKELTGKSESSADGWQGEGLSCFAPAGFTTNMKIGTRLDLVDENTANRLAGRDGDPAEYTEQAMRSYKFYLAPTGTFESWPNTKMNQSEKRTDYFNYRSPDQETYEYVISGGMFEPNRYYKVTQTGYCKEIRQGKEMDPYYKKEGDKVEKPYPWDDKIVRYFHTGNLPNNLMEGNQIAFTLPQKAGGKRFYKNEMESPQIHMAVDRTKAGDDIFNTSKYDFVARFEKKVNGKWVPADAVVRVDTYKDGNNYYYVDEQGNVDYTIKVNSSGQVIATQVDPFEQHDNQGDYYTYQNKTYRYYGVNRERLQRFNASLSQIMTTASEIAKTHPTFYFPLKWIPTGFNSLEKAIEYYLAMINAEVPYARGQLSSVTTALNALKTELNDAMKNYYYPAPKDVDIRYVYQGATTIPNNSQQVQKRAKTAKESMQQTFDAMQRCLNDGEIRQGNKKIYDNRHQMPLYYYEQYIKTYDGKMNEAWSDLTSGFSSFPTSIELNELKALYLSMSDPYNKIKVDYESAKKVETVLAKAKKQMDNVKANYIKDIRSSKQSLDLKKNRLQSMDGWLKENFASYRKQVNIYPEYYMSKEVVQICDAFTDSLNALTKYVAYLDNTKTVKDKATELENLLKNVQAYMDKTPEASRSYSYVKYNYYSKAVSAFNAAEKATNHGSDYERAKTAFNAIESVIFNSEKLALEFAKEQKTESNNAYNKARNAANDAVKAADNVLAEMRKTSSSNDNAAQIQALRDKEEKACATAYELADAVADIAADVILHTSRHTGEMKQSSAANQMRQIVKDCQTNADNAKKNYKNAIEKADFNRLTYYWQKADNAFYNCYYAFDHTITDSNTYGLKNNASKAKSYAQTVKECRDAMMNMNNDHLYTTYAHFWAELADYCASGAKYVADNTRSDWSLNQAAYELNMIAQRTEYLTRGLVISGRNTNDEKFAAHMLKYAERAKTTVDKIKLSSKASSTTKSSLTNYKNKVADYFKSATKNAASRKGNHLVMEPNPVMLDGVDPTAPLYAATPYRSTVPGVAEAFELAAETPSALNTPNTPSTPETPENPDGPAGAAVVAKVASMMNASLPKPKPKPSIPAESVINSASAMLNGGAYPSFGTAAEAAAAAPDVPAASSVPGPPDGVPFSSATNVLKNAYSQKNKKTTASENTSGATMHVDVSSLSNSKLATIPVELKKMNNGRYHYLQLKNFDMFKSTAGMGNSWDKYEYRVVIMQVDKVKFSAAQLESQKEIEKTKESAEFEKSSQQNYLSATGIDGTETNGETISLQAYMANYYKEMEEQGLEENEGEASKTKLKKQTTANYKNFASEIYEWPLNFKSYLIVDDFASWAGETMYYDGKSSSPSYSYLDWNLEGLRPTKFTYSDASYSPASLAKKDDSSLLYYSDYYLKDPYVWLAYVGSYGLFNGRTVSSKSAYWNAPYSSPKALTVSFPTKSGWYRGRNGNTNIVEHTIGYSNRGRYIHVNYQSGGTKWEREYDLDKDGNYTHAYAAWKKNKIGTSVYYFNEASKFIKAIAVGYNTPSYNDCLAKNINQKTNKQDLYTAVDAIKDMLTDMHNFENEFRKKYYVIWGVDKKKINSVVSQWSGQTVGNDRINCPAYQVAMIHQMKWLVDNSRGEWADYFPGYPSRFYYGPDATVLSINNYKKGSKKDFRFNYKWYCNNLSSVTHEYYRCNAFDLVDQKFTVYNNSSKYTKSMVWKQPLKDFDSNLTYYYMQSTSFPADWK